MRRAFLFLYAGSGAAALIYEVAWTRLLTLEMGHTSAAASAVLAAFMGGLAIGAWLAGRIAVGRSARFLRLYSGLEVAVAIVALALPATLGASKPLFAWAYADGAAPLQFAVVRLAVSLVALGIPAAAMGATFPLAAAWYARDPAGVGALYAANTAGAAAGAVAAGFWLLPSLGLRGTTLVGVTLNIVAAAGAWWIASAVADTTLNTETSETTEKTPSRRATRRPIATPAIAAPAQPALAYAAAAISGFIALVYEVAWTRLIALVLGPTTYAFATMAAAFVAGVAIGSAAGARLARTLQRPAAWLGTTLVVTALAASAAAWFAASRLPLLVAAAVASPSATFGLVTGQQAATIALLLLPMTFALGATFSLALACAGGRDAGVGRGAARVYAANTVGAIAGALAGGFGLLPWLGLQTTFRVAAGMGIASGAAVWIWSATVSAERPPSADVRAEAGRRHARRRGALAGTLSGGAAAVAAVVLLVALPPWDRELLASGAYKYAPYMSAADFDTMLRAGRLEYYGEGAASTVSVRQLAGTRSMSIDGKVDASNGGDMLTQRLLGLLPALLHRQPRDICIIGLGSGVTLDAALATGTVERADVVEISPQVVEASAFFTQDNNGALGRPGVHVIVGDGRSHLLLGRRRYDIIISEPSNPWMAGVAALFTREFFEAARARLTSDGLLCQWAHTYDMSDADLRSIVATFASAFPQGTMWLVGDGDLLLIGTNGPSIETHLGGIGQYPQRGRASAFVDQLTMPIRLGGSGSLNFSSPMFELMSLYAGGPRELAGFGAGAPLQTDDRLALEFSAPHGIYGRSANENTARIRALLDDRARPAAVRVIWAQATDRSWTARGSMNLKAEAYASAYDDFHLAVSLNPRNAAALGGLSAAAAGAGRQADERVWLESLAAADPGNVAVRIELSRVRAGAGDVQGASAAAEEAMRLAPDDPRAAEQLASALADAGDADRLGALAERLLRQFPQRSEPLYYHASALLMAGRPQEAAAEVRQVVARDPRHARAQNLLGAACATMGDRDCARAAFDAALAADPREPSTYVNLGLFRLQSADAVGAADYFAEALALDPSSAAARSGLAQARSASKLP